MEIRRRVVDSLEAAGYSDIAPAHLAVLQHPPPAGHRPSELALRAGVSKQAMNHLIGQMEARGYLQRRALPHDRRGTGVWLTREGEAAVRLIRRTVAAIEQEWEHRLGSDRYAALRQSLVALDQLLDAQLVTTHRLE